MFTKLEFAFFKFINKILRFSHWIAARSALSGQTAYNKLCHNQLNLKPEGKKVDKSRHIGKDIEFEVEKSNGQFSVTY